MKTLGVLSVLIGIGIAAPAPQNGFQQNVFRGLETSEAIHPIDIHSEINGPSISARSHAGFKNPVIVKKKTGYHVYRDSTEERANSDPHENCGKQVRVKLCDDIAAKSADLRRSTKEGHHAGHTDDVEDSIKLAKEAVESLQRDLKTIDHDTSGKSAQWKHAEPDKDLHEDIEAARLALEHAQKNFGTLEAMNMRAATLRNSEVLNDIGKTKEEKERWAQWKQAMENIQRNVEIARNIEDSFKAAEDHSSFLNSEAIDTTKFMRSNSHQNEADYQKTNKQTASLATSGRKAFGENSNKKISETKSDHHTISQKKAEEHFGHDMKSSASETVEMKNKHQAHLHHNSKTSEGKLAEVSLNIKGQPLALKTDAKVQLAKDKGIHVDASLRNAHSNNKMSAEEKATKTTHLESAHKTTSNTEMSSRISHTDESKKKNFGSHNLQTTEHKTMQQGKTVDKKWESAIVDKNSKHEKSAWTETESKDMLMKSAEHNIALNTNLDHKIEKINTKLSTKSAEHSTEHEHHKNDAELFVKKSGLSVHSDMKLADNVEVASDVNLNGPINVQLNEGKSSEPPKGLDMEHARVTYGHHGHGHQDYDHHGHGHHDHWQGHGHGHGHGHHGHHGHHGYHGKSAELDSAMHPSTRMEMKEFSEKSALENMFQWKHHHDARSSYDLGGYGAGVNLAAPGGSGAVGVFPHAKIGGCGIPLLLSCSPSVVSGSLAKSHGYAAPSYRNGEESPMKIKRDIMKAKEWPIKNKDISKTIKQNDIEKKLQ